MPQYPPDTPEISTACDMLRGIYWREYGRGWRDAFAYVKRILELPPPLETGSESAPDSAQCDTPSPARKLSDSKLEK